MQVNQSVFAGIRHSAVNLSPGKILFAAWSAISLSREAKDPVQLSDGRAVVVTLSASRFRENPYIIAEEGYALSWIEKIPECLETNYGHLNPSIIEFFSTDTTGSVELTGKLLASMPGRNILAKEDVEWEAVEALQTCAQQSRDREEMLLYVALAVSSVFVFMLLKSYCMSKEVG